MKVRAARAEDLPEIEVLFMTVFDRPFKAAEWHWKYAEEGKGYVLTGDDGQIWGHTGYLRRRMVFGDERGTGALRVDTMVNPKRRGKGVYRKLLEESFQQEQEAGVTCFYGFPSDMAKGPLMKVTGAKAVSGVPKYRLITRPIALAGLYLPALQTVKRLDAFFTPFITRKVTGHVKKTSVTLRQIKKEKDFPEVPEKAQASAHVQALRDKQFVNQRYFKHPTTDYQVYAAEQNQKNLGYVVTSVTKRERKTSVILEGRIIDLALIEETDHAGVVGKAVNELILSGCAFIQLWALPGTQLEKAAKAGGFKKDGEPMTLVVKDNENSDLYDKAKEWQITMGDVDSY